MNLKFDKGTLTFDGRECEVPPGFLWDSRTSNFRAPAYLYRRSKKHFDDNNTVVTDHVMDNISDVNQFKTLPKSTNLFPYQEIACDTWEASGCQGIVVLPTGGGKTRLAIEIIQRKNTPTLILVPTKALMQQWKNSLEEFSNSEVGVIGDGCLEIRYTTVCTYESAYRRMAALGNKFELLIIDEVHHFGCGMRDEILLMSAAHMRLGLTASLPSESAHYGKLTKLTGPLIFERGINDLRGEFLSEFDHYQIPVQLTSQERLEYQASYSFYQQFTLETKWCWQELGWQAFSAYASQSETGRKALKSARRSRSIVSLCLNKQRLLRKLLEKHWNQRTFIFVASTQDACEITRQFLAYPITAAVGRSEREIILKKFNEGSLRALVACKVLNEGIDIPSAEVAIILGGTGNPREQIQRVGRVLRKCLNKRAIIYEVIAANTFEIQKSKRRNQS